MKKNKLDWLNTPLLKGLSWILFWFVIAQLLGSCTPEEYPAYNTDVVIIEREDPDTYTWSSWDDPNMGWETLPNGTGKYEFSIDGDRATLTSREIISSATYLNGSLDKTGTPLEVKGKFSVTATLVENGVFKIKY